MNELSGLYVEGNENDFIEISAFGRGVAGLAPALISMIRSEFGPTTDLGEQIKQVISESKTLTFSGEVDNMGNKLVVNGWIGSNRLYRQKSYLIIKPGTL